MLDKAVTHLRDMYQTILMDPDIHKGTEINDISHGSLQYHARRAEELGIKYSPLPPYEVLQTHEISVSELQTAERRKFECEQIE